MVDAARLRVVFDADTSGAERGVDSLKSKLGGLTDAVKQGFGFGVASKALEIGMAGVGKSFDFVKSAAIDLNNQLAQAQTAFTRMLGSGEKAQAFLQDLQQFAAKTPFEFKDVQEGAQRLMAMGVEAKNVLPLMEDLGNVAAASGKVSAESIDRLTLALGQMTAKGKVSGEELLQLQEAGVNTNKIFDVLAQQFGKSREEIQKMASDGKLSSDQFIAAFDQVAKRDFGGLMEAQSHTFAGAMSNIHDSLTMGIAEAFKPFFDWLTKLANALADLLGSNQFQEWVGGFQSAISNGINAIERFIGALKPVGAAIVQAFQMATSGNITGAIETLFGSILTKAINLGNQMLGAGATVSKTFAQGIVDGARQYITEAVNFVSGFIADFFIGHSPPPQGPLSKIDEGGKTLMTTFAAGMKDGLGGVSDVADGIGTTLDDGLAKFKDAAGSLDGLKAAAEFAGDAVQDLNHKINDIDSAELPIKESIQDITNAYEDQIDPLQRQLDLIKEKVDYTRQEQELNLDLQDLELRKQENALKPEQQGLDKQIKDLEKQMKGLGKGGSDASAEITQLQRKLRDLGSGKEVEAQRKAIQSRIDGLKDAQSADKDGIQNQRDAMQARIDALRDQRDGLDDNIKAQRDSLAIQKESLTLDDEKNKLQTQLAQLPLKQRIGELKDAEQDAIQPLQRSLEVMDRRKARIELERQQWNLLKGDISDAMEPLAKAQADAKAAAAEAKKAAGGAAGGGLNLPKGGPAGGGLDLGKPKSLDDQIGATKEQLKQQGAKAANDFLESAKKWIVDHLGSMIGSGIGSAVGGMAFGPIGALVGGLLGKAIGGSVEKKLRESGVDFQAVAQNWSAKLQTVGTFIGESVVPALLSFAGYVKSDVIPAVQQFADWVQTTGIPALQNLAGWFGDNIVPKVQAFAAFMSDTLMPAVQTVIEWIGTEAPPLLNKMADFFKNEILPPVMEVVAYFQATLWPDIQKVINDTGDLFKTLVDWTKQHWETIRDIIQPIVDGVQKHLELVWNAVKGTVSAVWTAMKGIIDGVLKEISGVIEFWTGIFSGDWGKAWDGIKTAYSGLWTAIQGIVEGALKLLATTLDTAWTAIGNAIDLAWGGMQTAIGKVWDAIKLIFTSTKDAVSSAITAPFDAAKTALESIGNGIKDNIAKPFAGAASAINSFVSGLKQAVNWVGGKLHLPEIFGGDPQKITVPGYARGGITNENLFLAGEEGPELIHAPRGSHVYTKAETERMLAGMANAPAGPGVGSIYGGNPFGAIASGMERVTGAIGGQVRDFMKKGVDSVVNEAFGAFGVNMNGMPDFLKGAGDAIFGMVKDGVVDAVKNLFAEVKKHVGGATGTWVSPMPGGAFMQGSFGSFSHSKIAAVDVSEGYGGPIVAPDGGTVMFDGQNGWSGGTGHTVMLDHENGWVTLYGHVHQLLKGLGESVDQGETFATEGSPENDGGVGSGAHLHFEMFKDHARVRPEDYIKFALGGTLNEPVIGQGLWSKRPYSFAEDGTEFYSTPKSRRGQGDGQVTVTFQQGAVVIQTQPGMDEAKVASLAADAVGARFKQLLAGR